MTTTAERPESPMVMARWFPAAVSLPVIPMGGAEPERLNARTARVYITAPPYPELIVYTEPSDEPAWRSWVDLEQTPAPPAGVVHPAPNLDIVTDAGLAIVTPRGGCGCGNRLRSWTPSWGSDVTPWRTT